MICTTIQNRNFDGILEALEQCEMAEIRLDRCRLTAEETEELFTSDVPLVATCRISEIAATEPSLQGLPEQSRDIKAMQIAEKRLIKAIEAGARYVDVEMEAPKQMSKRVRQAAHENGTVFIRSYHDFEGTDSFEALKALVEKCRYHGADVVKIVTTAHSQDDVDKVLSLYDWAFGEKVLSEGELIAFCMGEAGRKSRIDCIKYGAPYTYAALTEDEAAAPGQMPAEDMKKAVYGSFRFVPSHSELSMPSSKSFAQRAIIAAALAQGESHLSGYTSCGDNDAALKVAEALGAKVKVEGNTVTISGIAAGLGTLAELASKVGNAEEGSLTLHVGESGLLTRMMLPIMTQIAAKPVVFTGEKTLWGRPLTGAREIMEAFGVSVENCERAVPETTAEQTLRVPLRTSGALTPGRAELSGKHGSQLISGLLMALPLAQKNSSLIVREPKSIPYMFITMEVLKKFGIKMSNEMMGGRDFLESEGDWSLCTEMVFKVKGGQTFKAADIDIEGDWSAAANFLVAAAIFGKASLKGLDTTSLQADLSIMDILMDAGASLSQSDGDRGTIAVQRAPLKAFNVDASNCPDLFPIISVLAAFCQGTSRIAGVGRLANKESNRAKAILEMLLQMGVGASIEEDELIIKGYSLAQRLLIPSAVSVIPSAVEESLPALLRGGHYTSHHDHRMVMALKVASLGADSPIIIDDEECVAKSFPQFHEIFKQMLQ